MIQFGFESFDFEGGETTSGWVKHCAFDNTSNALRDEPTQTFVAIRASPSRIDGSNASDAQSHVYVCIKL